MRVILLSGVIGALLLSVVWAAPQDPVDHEGHDHQGHDADHFHHLHHGKDEAHPVHNPAESRKLSQANAEFMFKLYKKLSASPDLQSKNIFFSPLSISMALSMLSLGAKGDTFSQLYQALGYSEMTPETVNEAFEHIFHMLAHEKDMQLDVSNAVALRTGFQVMDKFLEDATHYYNSQAFNVDFSKPDVAIEEINKFIAQQTNDTIKDMVKDIDPETVMMLINCVYFKGEWRTGFSSFLTHKANFHVDENTKVRVDMMQSEGVWDIYEDKEAFITAVRLPYKGSASMIVVLPDENKMKDVEDSINASLLWKWVLGMVPRPIDLRVPKVSISGRFSLSHALEALGITNAFSDSADFSGMTATAVKVSKVEHEAILKVDEKGTEASAATTLEIVPRSAIMNAQIVEMNRPFFIFIADKSTASISFMGKITNPSEK